jgi:hypothetical protein
VPLNSTKRIHEQGKQLMPHATSKEMMETVSKHPVNHLDDKKNCWVLILPKTINAVVRTRTLLETISNL